jgi:hypothetical protein
LSEWKQEKETLEAQSKVAEKQVQYSPPKTVPNDWKACRTQTGEIF